MDRLAAFFGRVYSRPIVCDGWHRDRHVIAVTPLADVFITDTALIAVTRARVAARRGDRTRDRHVIGFTLVGRWLPAVRDPGLGVCSANGL